MPKVLKEKVEEIKKICQDVYRITVRSEYISSNAAPGQFVNVKCCEGLNTLLRRPVSICTVNREAATFDLVFQVKGKGTGYLSRIEKNEEINIIGPLGRSFHLSDEYGKIAVIGGGIGIFPLLFLLQSVEKAQKTAFLGFRDKNAIVLEDEFRKAADTVHISTDDGSIGYRGMVTDLLKMSLNENKYDIIYACGPVPMLREVSKTAYNASIRCQVSLEQRMGCGIGACLVCACKTRTGDGWDYSHVCKDGPVFWSSEVIFDE